MTSRLAIDATAAVNQVAGVGRAARETIAALARRDDRPALTLFYVPEGTPAARANERWLTELVSTHPAVLARRIGLPPRWTTFLWLRHRLPLPLEWVVGSADVVLGPDFVVPPTRRARSIVTIHDLSYLVLPEHADPHLRRYLATAVPRSLRGAAHVIAVSETTRQDAIRHLALDPGRITTIANGVDPRFQPLRDDQRAATRQRLGLPPRFILTVGMLEPRKNHATLLRAFARLAGEHADVTLVIAGRRGWLEQPIFDTAAQLGLGDRVRFLGHVADADLPDLVATADVFAYPSWYEGFGLPALEAMACGVPVVTSNVSALPEVCGDAALLVPPADAAAVAAALLRALTDSATRERLTTAGPQRAARYTWDATATGILALLERLAAAG